MTELNSWSTWRKYEFSLFALCLAKKTPASYHYILLGHPEAFNYLYIILDHATHVKCIKGPQTSQQLLIHTKPSVSCNY